MSLLMNNAVASIRMGVEDFQRNEPNRALSSVRNFYSGLLLLSKEVLIRANPNADPEIVIAARHRLVSDGSGGLAFKVNGTRTIDFETIGIRFKEFKIPFDTKPLKNLNRIRNEIEHRFTEEPEVTVREALAEAFPVAVDLFRLANENPADLLGAEWQIMIETRHVYEAERKRCRSTFQHVNWLSESIKGAQLGCPECGSALLEQIKPHNVVQEDVIGRCNACGEMSDYERIIVTALSEIFNHELYYGMTDGIDCESLINCPECSKESFLADEKKCAICGAEYSQGICGVCSEVFDWDWVFYGDSDFLCSYHSHITSKND